jgi:inhibitor of cysteine peptidase
LATLLVFALALAACGKSTGATVTLLETDSGRTVELVRGDKLIIQMEASPTTGYTWEAVSLDTSVLKQQGDPEFKEGQPGMMGGGGTLVFTFQAVGKGQIELKMVYHQPWDKDTPPAKTLDVTVIVK